MKNKINIKKYSYIEHLSDIGIDFYGSRLEQLFENAAAGMFSIMCDLKTIKPVVKKTVTVSVKNADYEDLVISWLDRLVYLYEVNNMLFSDFRIAEIKEKDGSMMLKAEIYGEHMDLQRHKLRAGVKAATYHKLEVSKDKESGNWKGRVIFDV